jgi:hypothetical protein
VIRPEVLPPTEGASHFHSMLVYFQVMEWKHLKSNLHLQDWGWKLEKGLLMPITTDQDPAPASLLNVIRCKCTASACSNRCSCRKNGLPCVTACFHCHSLECKNIQEELIQEEEDTTIENNDEFCVENC